MRFGARAIIAATLSPRDSSKIDGSATPLIVRPRRFSFSVSTRRMFAAIWSGDSHVPRFGTPVVPYNSAMRNSRPSSSAAYQPTEYGRA